MNNSQTLLPTAEDQFAVIVRDLVEQTFPHRAPGADDDLTVVSLVDRITDVFTARLDEARRIVHRKDVEIATLVDRDRMKELLIGQLKHSAAELVSGAAGAATNALDLHQRYESMRQIMTKAREAGRDTIFLADLEDVVTEQQLAVRPPGPIVLGLATSSRFSHGQFTGSDPAGVRTHYAYVGEAVILHAVMPRSDVEHAFLVDGHVVCESALAQRGLILERLL